MTEEVSPGGYCNAVRPQLQVPSGIGHLVFYCSGATLDRQIQDVLRYCSRVSRAVAPRALLDE